MAKAVYHAHYHDNGVQGEDSFLIRAQSSVLSVYAVMDGLTNNNGKRASMLVKRKLEKGRIEAYGDLVSLISDANGELFRAKELGHHHAYTTVAAALQVGRELHIISVGDSPAILVRGGLATQLAELDRISRRNVRAAVGLSRILQPHYAKVTLEKGDALVLMTDGVSDNLSFEGIAAIVSSSATPKQAAAGLKAALEHARTMDTAGRQTTFRDDDATAVIRYFTSFA